MQIATPNGLLAPPCESQSTKKEDFSNEALFSVYTSHLLAK